MSEEELDLSQRSCKEISDMITYSAITYIEDVRNASDEKEKEGLTDIFLDVLNVFTKVLEIKKCPKIDINNRINSLKEGLAEAV